MDEKQSTFTVTDRRKFTLEGDLRDDAATEPGSESGRESGGEPGRQSGEQPETAAHRPDRSDKVVTMPSPEQRAAEPVSEQAPFAEAEPEEDELLTDTETEAETDAEMPQFSARETAEQHAAYQQSARQLDDMLRQANPGMGAAAAVTFEHIIQSFYVSAMIAMGAGTEPGQKPRIDILGARQSVDMLALLQEKTKGNLTPKEEATLQNVLFELRMMFLEITNAISQAAHRPANDPGRGR